MEGSPSQETSRLRRSASKKHGISDTEECQDVVSPERPEDISSEIEREFLREVEHAEELAKVIEPGMPLIIISLGINICCSTLKLLKLIKRELNAYDSYC